MNEREYGGYFELERFRGEEYHTECAVAFNYCRTAWQYLLAARKIAKVYLPYYLCQTMTAAALRNGVNIEYYHIDEAFRPLCSNVPKTGEAILIVNYFGFLSPDTIQELVQKYGHVILDNTQAFFSSPHENIDTLYSCRKFFGVPDGGYLVARDLTTPQIEEDRSMERMTFLLGRLEDGASSHYAEFRDAEDRAGSVPVRLMSKTTHDLLRGIDYKYVKNTREKNYLRLHSRLGALNQLSALQIPVGPYMYPLYYDGDAAALRTYLVHNRVYVPTLWSDVHDLLQGNHLELQLVDHIIPLPVDQRYSLDDMDRIAAIVKEGLMQC